LHLNQGDLNDIGSVEKSILRLAVYEIVFADLPKAVVINEAIELSKRLASDGAPKFVNGLLDKVTKA
jgi:N utilization substance protein B